MDPVYCCGHSFFSVQTWRQSGKNISFLYAARIWSCKSLNNQKKKTTENSGKVPMHGSKQGFACVGLQRPDCSTCKTKPEGTSLGKMLFRAWWQAVGGSCFIPIPSWASPGGALLPSAESSAERGWGEHPPLPTPCPPPMLLVWLCRRAQFYSLVSMSSNELSKSPPLHMVRLQFLNTCSMGKSNPISCNTKPCTAPQWGLFSCQIASFKPQPIQL